MKSVIRIFALLIALGSICSISASAQEKSVESATSPIASASELSAGEVRKIDKENGKVTIRHGELKNLDMPPMTMVFQVKEPALLEKIKVGDKIRFRAEKAGSALIITEILNQ